MAPLTLYRSLLRQAKSLKDYNFRSYAVRRVRAGFQENKELHGWASPNQRRTVSCCSARTVFNFQASTELTRALSNFVSFVAFHQWKCQFCSSGWKETTQDARTPSLAVSTVSFGAIGDGINYAYRKTRWPVKLCFHQSAYAFYEDLLSLTDIA